MEAHKVKCPQCNHENPPSTIYCEECGEMLIHIQYSQEKSTKDEEEPAATLESPGEAGASAEAFRPASQELRPGSVFAGRYKVIEKLGEGRTGLIYKALDSKTHQEISLKLIKSEVAPDDKAFKRIQKEFKPMRKLSNKQICRMYHLGTFKGTRYIAMEYVTGENLKDAIERMGQFTFRKSLFTAKQICEGLAEAHRLGLIHGNLKPQNIMIDEFGNVRIMELGLAGLTRGWTQDAGAYKSPEQIRGEEIDQSSDIYSLGLILYEMLTTRLPITGEIPVSLAKEQQIPGNFSRMILKCLAREKGNRIQDAEEMLEELKRHDTGSPSIEKEIPERKPAPAKKKAVRFDIQKILVPGLIVMGVAVVAILIRQFFFLHRIGPIPEGKPSIVVMYFENNTANMSLDDWGRMIAESFIADLNQSKYLEILSSERLYEILNDLNQLGTKSYSPVVLKEVARQAGADYIIFGNSVKDEDTIRIQVFLRRIQKEKPIASWSEECRGESCIFQMVDGLTRKIKERLKLNTEQFADDLDRDVSQITTGSLEAFKYYLQGQRDYLEGNYRQSIASMEKAITLDTEFALAFKYLAMDYARLGLSSQGEEAVQKVMTLNDRISQKELYDMEGDYFRGSEETYDKAIDAYTKLIQLYPDDANAHLNLGGIYFTIEEFDKALEQFEQIKGDQAEIFNTFALIADVYMMKGLYDKAEEVLRNYLADFSNKSWTHHFLAFTYIANGNSYFAQHEIDQAIALDHQNPLSPYLKGVYFTLTNSFGEAEDEYRNLLERKDPTSTYLGYHGLANLKLVLGRLNESRKYLNGVIDLSRKIGGQWIESQALSISALRLLEAGRSQEALGVCNLAMDAGTATKRLDLQRLALHYKGLAYVALRSFSRAQRTAEQLKELIEKGSHSREIRRYHHLIGMIELERKNYSEAIENLELALSILPHQSSLGNESHIRNSQALFINSLALAYYRSGNLEQAAEQYERIGGLTSGRLFFGYIFAKSFYTLGRIYERLGEDANAEENYNKFLALWFNADPGISEVNDAKSRLSRLNRKP